MGLRRRLGLLLLVVLLPVRAMGGSTEVLVLETERLEPYRVALESLEKALRARSVARLLVDPDEPEEGLRRVTSHAPRVIVTMGSTATAWALKRTQSTPVVFAMVLHPVQSGFARSFGSPGGRVTGAALDISPDVQLRALRDMLDVRRVGVLYDPAQSRALVSSAQAAARRAGIQLLAVEVPRLAALEAALERLDGSVDALWSIPDPTVYTSAGAERILLFTLQQRLPFVGLSEHYVRAGALLALSASYEENGEQAAARVERVLQGEAAGRIPVGRPGSIEVVLNRRTERRLGREVSRPAGLGFRPLH